MATTGSKLIIRRQQWHANMTELNHLGAALLIKPEKIKKTMDTLFSAQYYYSDNPLSSMLMGKKITEEEIDTYEWEWDLKGASTRPLVVLEDIDPTDTTKGKWGNTFRLKLDENWFIPGDVIYPGSTNKKFQARVEDFPVKHGNGWVYTLRLMTDDQQLFIPQKYFQPGTQWAKLYSVYAEGADQSGSTQFSTPITLRNRMWKLRKQYKITADADNAVLAVAIPTPDGKYVSSWIKYAEAEYWRQWYRERERAIWYMRSTDTVLDSNGRPIRSGPGIQEQLEDSNIHYYTHLTARLIEEYLMDIFYSRVKPGQRKEVVGFTGEYGMLAFHRAVMDWMNKNGFIKNVEVFTNKVKSEYHPNALEVGFKIVKYTMATGISLRLVHNPLYDDREINFEIDPITGYPLESQRITFLDFTGGEGYDSNVKLKRKRKGYAFGYVEGLYGPYGPSKGKSSAHAGEYYEMHVSETFGIHIHDVTKCGELILARN